MPLFPDIGPQYYDDNNRGILSQMEKFYTDSISINQSFWAEADTDTRFEAGDQTLWEDIYGNLPANRKRQFNFNRIRRVVNMVGGHQRRNRKSTIVVPVENGDGQTADQFTKVLMWASDQENMLETISESFHGALVTGLSLLQVWVDYRTDPISGNIKVDNCSYNSFLMDPFFKKADLSDCNHIWKRSYISKKECVSLLPESKDVILSLNSRHNRDGKFQYLPENYNYDTRDLVTYDEYYYRDYRPQRMLVDTQTGETMEWRSDNEDGLKDFIRFYPQMTVIEQNVPTVKLAIVVEGRVLYDGPNPTGSDKYPFIPVFGYYNPQIAYYPWRIQGLVRGLRDAQFLYNRRKAIELDILESQINSGWKYKENALVNPKDVFLSGQGRGLALKEDAQMADVEQIVPVGVHASTIQLSQILAQEIPEISGVNEELLGSATDEIAGVLSRLRQGAGLTTLQILFDQLDRSQRLLGKLLIDIIQVNFTPGKVKKIIEEEPLPQFYNKAFGKYDAAVEEGFNTTTQKQLQFAQLLQLRETGVAVPDHVLLEASTLQNKDKLVKAVQEQSQKAAEQQAVATQVAIEEQQASIKLSEARAMADEGLGMERISRIDENQALAVERRAEAQKDRDQGILNLVKALKEIEDVDLEQVRKMMVLTKMVEGREEAQNDSTFNQV